MKIINFPIDIARHSLQGTKVAFLMKTLPLFPSFYDVESARFFMRRQKFEFKVRGQHGRAALL